MFEQRRAFTLVELVVVVTIFAILAAAVYVAIDPTRRINEARNADRNEDLVELVDALARYEKDNGASYQALEEAAVGNYYMIGTCTAGAESACALKETQSNCIDLAGLTASYLEAIPMDPVTGSPEMTSYYLQKNEDETLTLGTCSPDGEGPGGELDPVEIEITR